MLDLGVCLLMVLLLHFQLVRSVINMDPFSLISFDLLRRTGKFEFPKSKMHPATTLEVGVPAKSC